MAKNRAKPQHNSEGSTPNEKGAASDVSRPQQKMPVPDVDELLHMLLNLNLVVIMDEIPERQAILLQKNLQTILHVQLNRTSHTDAGQNSEALMDVARRHPAEIPALKDYLSDEQLQTLMAEMSDDSHDPA